MEFRPKTHESGLRFGLTWSAMGSVLAVSMLASCAYIIPPDNQAPRHNEVLGMEKRRPVNHQVAPTSRAPSPTVMQHAAVQGVQPVPPSFASQYPLRRPSAQPTAPSVAASTPPTAAQIPDQPFVTQPGPAHASSARRASADHVGITASERAHKGWLERNFPQLAAWFGVAGTADADTATAEAQQAHGKAASGPRQPASVPFGAGQPETAHVAQGDWPDTPETLAPAYEASLHDAATDYQTAAAGRYPLLQDTPPSPQLTADELRAIREAKEALEADQRDAERARDALDAELDAEPSLLEEYPRTQGGAHPDAGKGSRSQSSEIRSFDETYGFAAPTMRAASEPLEPIVLRPPKGVVVHGASASPKILRVTGATPHIVSQTSNAYLPESRYVGRR
jgi:hypothetical protein